MRERKKRVEIKIEGHVQGVFFRQGTMHQARLLALIGFVRNESDGSVLVIAEGEENALHKLIEWCKKGTDHAWVKRADAAWQEATGEFEGFEII